MRILVLSDSHSGLSFAKRCIQATRPDTLIHLGDYYEDGQALHQSFPKIPFYQVPGNCDRGRTPLDVPEILISNLAGADVYMTHGHLHGVKSGNGKLLAAARASGCAAVLYGHTHQSECYQEDSGLWVLNPGTCGMYGGSAGLMEIRDGRVVSCRVIHEDDLLGI